MEANLIPVPATPASAERNCPFWSLVAQCNPFYLASALFLIYGVYRFSVDPNLFASDTRQLIFYFGALKVYSGMLVVAALFLARRKIWYDSTLLFFLENILALIPFMLISHAVFLEPGTAWGLALAGAGLIGLRFTAFARKFPGLNLPGPLLAAGAAILAFNIAVPLVFRAGLENEANNSELWRTRAMYCWYVALPLLALLGRIVPRADAESAPQLSHQQRWIPMGVFLIWITSSATHLGTIGYVDDQVFRFKLIVPLLWAVTWLLCDRLGDFVRDLEFRNHPHLLIVPALVPICALVAAGLDMFLALTAMNVLIFTTMFLGRRIPFALKLATASSIALYLAVPREMLPVIPLGLNKWDIGVALALTAGIAASIGMRHARGGVLGSICIAAAIGGATYDQDWSAHLALQAAAVFHLLHSLRWMRPLERGSNATAIIAAAVWLTDAFVLRNDPALWATMLPLCAAIVLFLGIAALRARISARTALLALTGILAMLLQPVSLGARWIMDAPAGALALAASFALFGLGTLHALRGQALLGRMRSAVERQIKRSA